VKQFVQDLLNELHPAQFWPAERLESHQRRLLDPLLRHARTHVPFYRNSGRLDPLFRRDGTIDWDRWSDIPRLSRGEAQGAGEQLCAEFVPPEHGMVERHVTSGSSGEPVTVWHTHRFNPAVRTAVNIRNFDRHGIDPSQSLAFFYPFAPEDFDIRQPRRHGAKIDRYSEAGLFGERYDIADTRPPSELIEALISIRPKLIRAQPIVLDLMCAHDRERRLSDLGITTVLGVGDHFSDKAKQRISEHLGCWIIDSYGSVECGRIANSCPHCDCFHVEDDTVLLEVLTERGSAALPGEEGDVFVTPFHNYAMPLIRYDLDDRAIVGARNGCSITLSPLTAVLGRKRTLFVFGEGIAVAPLLPLQAIMEFLGAQAFQVAQIGRDRCEFRIVPGRVPWSEMRFGEMTALMRAMWWSELQVDYREVEVIPRHSQRGKLASYVQELPADLLPDYAGMIMPPRAIA
jgi:phenylacetate-CoA ligase